MQDAVVLESLHKKGITLDENNIVLYESIERKPRVLDKMPSPVAIHKAENIQAYGCANEFVIDYRERKKLFDLPIAWLDVNGVRRSCDVEVFIVLQSLIYQGITYNKDRADACFNMFKLIFMIQEEHVSIGVLNKVLANYKTESYYEQELKKGIRLAVFGGANPEYYWLSLIETNGMYATAMKLGSEVIQENCKEISDVKKFLNPLYREAKEDKEFMSRIYKPAANKWLIAMLWYLKDKNPEALEPGKSSHGFA